MGAFPEDFLRRSSILTISAVSCVLFGVAAMRLNLRFSSAQAAAQTAQAIPAVAAATPQGEHLEAVKATLPTALKPADGLQREARGHDSRHCSSILKEHFLSDIIRTRGGDPRREWEPPG
jgi:hypothetical protein